MAVWGAVSYRAGKQMISTTPQGGQVDYYGNVLCETNLLTGMFSSTNPEFLLVLRVK